MLLLVDNRSIKERFIPGPWIIPFDPPHSTSTYRGLKERNERQRIKTYVLAPTTDNSRALGLKNHHLNDTSRLRLKHASLLAEANRPFEDSHDQALREYNLPD